MTPFDEQQLEELRRSGYNKPSTHPGNRPAPGLSERAATVRPGGGQMNLQSSFRGNNGGRMNLQGETSNRLYTRARPGNFNKAPGLGAGLALGGAAQQMFQNPDVQRGLNTAEQGLQRQYPNYKTPFPRGTNQNGGFFIKDAYGADQPPGTVLTNVEQQQTQNQPSVFGIPLRQEGVNRIANEGLLPAVERYRQEKLINPVAGGLRQAYGAVGNFAGNVGRAIFGPGQQQGLGEFKPAQSTDATRSPAELVYKDLSPEKQKIADYYIDRGASPDQAINAAMMGLSQRQPVEQQGLPQPKPNQGLGEYNNTTGYPNNAQFTPEQVAELEARKQALIDKDLIQSERDYWNFEQYGIVPSGNQLSEYPAQTDYYAPQELGLKQQGLDLQGRRLGLDERMANAEMEAARQPKPPVMQTLKGADGEEYAVAFDSTTGQRVGADRISKFISALSELKGQDEQSYKKILQQFGQEFPYDYKQYLSLGLNNE